MSGGDEYDDLLRFAHAEAAKLNHGDDDLGKDKSGYYRPWFAPWVKLKGKNNMDLQVPADWLRTEIYTGLSSGPEIERRRAVAGYNELESPDKKQVLKFISRFRGPVLYVMELAVCLGAGQRNWIEFGVIIGLPFLKAMITWYQEKRANNVVAQLKSRIAMRATVVRDGYEQELEARYLVPGDILVLEGGSTIPADAKIIADYADKCGSPVSMDLSECGRGTSNFSTACGIDKGPTVCTVDRSAITGESLAVDHSVGDTVYYTCGVQRGKVYAMVTASAPYSFVGKTARLQVVPSGNDVGHYQVVLNSIGTALHGLVIAVILIVWIGAFSRNVDIAIQDSSLLVYALIFLIAGVPVGLPYIIIKTMAVGAAYLAKRKVIAQKLTAIESLAGVDILCSDKTGTLTANRLSLDKPFVAPGVHPDWLMAVAILASSHNTRSLDPVDKVTIVGLKDYPGAQAVLRTGWHTRKFTPSDPVLKCVMAEVDKDGRNFTCAKGSPDAILRLDSFDQDTVAAYLAKADEFAQCGFSPLGVACKEEGEPWKLLGMLCMVDPPRDDTAATIREAMNFGVSVKMLTSDAVATAIQTCQQLGLGTHVYDSERLITSAMPGSEVRDFIEGADGFAEVFPDHKYQVVEMLQERSHLMAITGSRVNDAPSLKKADCGIAVKDASDATRMAADVVVLEEGLSTMITAIKVARQILHRMKAYIIYRIALCIHLEAYLCTSMLILNETIRVDLIVFIAILADVAAVAIAYDNAPYDRRPVDWQLPKVWILSTVMGLLLAAGTWVIRSTLPLNVSTIQEAGSVQEILFLEVVLTESWIILITRMARSPNSGPFVWPSWQLIGAILGVDVLASIFVIFGWLSVDPAIQGGFDIVAVAKIWCYSFGVVVIIGLAYYFLNKVRWLDNVGRRNRSHRDPRVEDLRTEMQRLTSVHKRQFL
ncbi:uncharacterized protein C8Q71DRAFT_419758 [Rhodofomes roseus]|uniref:Plasma membrane ATPase n=1 Tax=Rhodofomes roseus TaxID=34475 RepID=A0ABQ8KPY9_9APHY|nr:uncharacterized protein C8Q71DRAFT_419758 [Rhodofomes roseus]KAH9840682.1 hypothetical protein C8Q71DRAFT_419758 [Rhodofomes roseus]